MKEIFITILFCIFIIKPLYAGCVTLYGNITWQRVDSNTIIVYKSGDPYAKIDLEYGTFINSYSQLEIIDDYPCSYSSDVFLIDGEVVDVRSIDKF
tara:strand:+ start:67 stop:354 length:288 start_codon:yes stop_codon:yes gene_type:complete